MRCIGDGAGDTGLDAVLDLVEAFHRAAGILVDEGLVALIDVGGQQLGGLGVGAGDDQCRHAHDVGGKPRGIQVADVRRGRDENLAAEMAALLFRCQLVLEMNARGAGFDEGLHDLEGIQRSAETGFRVGDDRREPGIDRKALAFGGLDLVGALQRAVDALGEFRRGIGRIERLVRIHGGSRVGIRRDLPARQIDRLEPGADHLHGLLPDSAPSALTKSSSCRSFHRRFAPISARLCLICTEPRSRFTSSGE